MLEAPVVSTPGGSALRTARGRTVSAVSVSFPLRSTSVLVPGKKTSLLYEGVVAG